MDVHQDDGGEEPIVALWLPRVPEHAGQLFRCVGVVRDRGHGLLDIGIVGQLDVRSGARQRRVVKALAGIHQGLDLGEPAVVEARVA